MIGEAVGHALRLTDLPGLTLGQSSLHQSTPRRRARGAFLGDYQRFGRRIKGRLKPSSPSYMIPAYRVVA